MAETATVEKKAKPELTPEQKAAKDAKRKEYADARTRILKFKDTLKDDGKDQQALKDALGLFIHEAAARGRTSNTDEIMDKIIKSGKTGVSEMDIFNAYFIGRPDMKSKIRAFTLETEPAKRAWIYLDEEKRAYFCAGIGEKPPKDYTGFIPIEKKETI
jgi:hypothetical protein